MPISEDEYDHHKTQHHGMSKAEQRRPARHSKLEKADILEMTVKHLQTIQRQQLAVAVATDPTVLHKFKTGFNECASEVSRYISRIEGVEPAVKQRLVAHLSNCVTGLQQLSPFTFGSNNAINTINSVFPTMGTSALHLPLQQGPNTPTSTTGLPTILPQIPPGDVNNNHHHNTSARLQMSGGLQLIPSRLPTGELALLLPNTGQIPGNVLPFFPPPAATQGTTAPTLTTATATSTLTTASAGPTSTVTSGSIDRSHPSAFTAVMKSQSPVPVSNRSRSPSSLPQNICMSRTKSGSPAPLSPTSSISSCDTTDTYPSPNTPPPQQSVINQQTSVSSHFLQMQSQSYPVTVNASNRFKPHLENPSGGFKVFHFPVMEPQKPPHSPQQQHLVTSTSSPATETTSKMKHPTQPADSSSGLLSTVTEVKVAFQTVPMTTSESLSALSSHGSFQQMNPSNTFHHSLSVTQSTPVDQCLSVITSGAAFIEGQSVITNKDPPLDFSVKKEDFQTAPIQTGGKRQHSTAFPSNETSSDLLAHAYHSPTKMLRFSFTPNEIPQKSNPKTGQGIEEGLLKCSESKSHLSVVVEDLSNKPSTSSAVVTTTSAAQTSTKDMWRPW
ncbi:hypothetical protein C0J52_12374 [Blattella germanica]|nr:hypothetical protein C0J52_12374 [Blattella germanica]